MIVTDYAHLGRDPGKHEAGKELSGRLLGSRQKAGSLENNETKVIHNQCPVKRTPWLHQASGTRSWQYQMSAKWPLFCCESGFRPRRVHIYCELTPLSSGSKQVTFIPRNPHASPLKKAMVPLYGLGYRSSQRLSTLRKVMELSRES